VERFRRNEPHDLRCELTFRHWLYFWSSE
jgi:hypothetical protein